MNDIRNNGEDANHRLNELLFKQELKDEILDWVKKRLSFVMILILIAGIALPMAIVTIIVNQRLDSKVEETVKITAYAKNVAEKADKDLGRIIESLGRIENIDRKTAKADSTPYIKTTPAVDMPVVKSKPVVSLRDQMEQQTEHPVAEHPVEEHTIKDTVSQPYETVPKSVIDQQANGNIVNEDQSRDEMTGNETQMDMEAADEKPGDGEPSVQQETATDTRENILKEEPVVKLEIFTFSGIPSAQMTQDKLMETLSKAGYQTWKFSSRYNDLNGVVNLFKLDVAAAGKLANEADIVIIYPKGYETAAEKLNALVSKAEEQKKIGMIERGDGKTGSIIYISN